MILSERLIGRLYSYRMRILKFRKSMKTVSSTTTEEIGKNVQYSAKFCRITMFPIFFSTCYGFLTFLTVSSSSSISLS